MKHLTIDKLMKNSKESFFANHLFAIHMDCKSYDDDCMLVLEVFIKDVVNLGVDDICNKHFNIHFPLTPETNECFNFIDLCHCEFVFFREQISMFPINEINEMIFAIYEEVMSVEDWYLENY